jgi:hypothetical protein
MIVEPAYKKQYYCHNCKKFLPIEFVDSHKTLGHSVEIYLTMPNLPKYQKQPVSAPAASPDDGIEETLIEEEEGL